MSHKPFSKGGPYLHTCMRSKINIFSILLAVYAFIYMSGCDSTEKASLDREVELNRTIGSLARIYESGGIQVRGWGIVAGLNGTGSSECDPKLRRQLIKHIQKRTDDNDPFVANMMLNSKDTAVVDLFGTIPALAAKGDHFDIAIGAMINTQTTSLDGGTLYATDLKEMARIVQYDQFIKTLATAEGAVYIDKIDDKTNNPRIGHIIGGGAIDEPVDISLSLIEPNYYVASAIRNQLNKRFGVKTAKAISAAKIMISIPSKYHNSKKRFLEMVNQSFLASNPQLERDRIDMLINRLQTDENKVYTELALEAIGNSTLYKLTALLKSDDSELRFHTARCVLAIGDVSAIPVLKEFIYNVNGKFRIEAVQAIGKSAPRNEAIAALKPLLRDDDFELRKAAYEQLLPLKTDAVVRSLVGSEYFMDSVVARGKKIIYVTRSSAPAIVLFGDPILCKKNLFTTSPDGQVTINAQAGQLGISLMRQHPKSPNLIGPIRSSHRVKDLIYSLGNFPTVKRGQKTTPGLAVSYSEIVAILKNLCDSKSIEADFIAEPMPRILPVKKIEK